MLMISSRRDFWSATEFADVDDTRDVVLTDANPASDTPISEAELLARVAGQRVLLLVHGYNNTEDDVSLAYARIEHAIGTMVAGKYDLVVGYTWPGGALGLSYPIARARANTAGPRVAPWLTRLARKAASLDVMSHSLGARVMLKALPVAPRTPARPVRNLYLFAAAVDNESIERGEEFYDATKRAETTVVMHSKKDKTLAVLYRIGDAVLPWQWFDLFDSALGYSGPEDPADIIAHSPHVKVVNGKAQDLDHGDYKDHPAVYGYMKSFLVGRRPEQFYSL
jgi:esterase/lipase superfamily enzyme